MKTLTGLVGLFITLPIWYYLIYKILQGVQATELMWFLFWVYVPTGIFVQVAQKLTEGKK